MCEPTVHSVAVPCGFRSNACDIPAAILHPIPKTELLRKKNRVHSLPLLEIAPKPCYKKLHPKYPNNIFVPRQKGPGPKSAQRRLGAGSPQKGTDDRATLAAASPHIHPRTGVMPSQACPNRSQKRASCHFKLCKWAPTSNRQCTTNRIRPNPLKTNDGKISNRRQNTH